MSHLHANLKHIFYKGLRIYLIENEIYNLRCKRKDCMSFDGIRVGDSKEKVISVYGRGRPPYSDPEKNTKPHASTSKITRTGHFVVARSSSSTKCFPRTAALRLSHSSPCPAIQTIITTGTKTSPGGRPFANASRRHASRR